MVRSFRWLGTANPEVGKPYDQAWEALKAGKLEKAVKLYDQALTRDPNHAASWTEKARALRQLGRLEEAMAAHQKALEILPDDYGIKSDLINVIRDRAVRRSRGGGAELDDADLTLLKQLYPDVLACEHPERMRMAWVMVGWLLMGSAANDDAIRILEEAVKRWPQDVVAWTDLGSSYRAAGRLEDAIRCFCEGMRLASGGRKFEQDYAKDHLDDILKNFPELVEDPTRTAAICETFPPASPSANPEAQAGSAPLPKGASTPREFYVDGAAAAWADPPRPEEAIERYRAALRANDDLRPGSEGRLDQSMIAECWHGIGLGERLLGRYREAVEAFEAALSFVPPAFETLIAKIHLDLARALALGGKAREAIAALRKATVHDPSLGATLATDKDLASLKDEPGFRELVGKAE
jgi:tetratricopeptide (TPR) repeat protein